MTALTKLTIGFSPCPNDCFIFDAMVHGKIDTEGLQFELLLEDVEALNQRAFKNELHITKLSYHAYIYLTHLYQLLDAGSALGNGCGPLLIAKGEALKSSLSQGNDLKVAIPGKYTTANFLFSLAFPHVKSKVETLFSDIENDVVKGKVDAGVIIHENRFTYEQKGLKKLIDLGEYWETLTKAPIPLGGIVIQRQLPEPLKQKVNRVLRKSVEYAFQHPKSSLDFVKAHAQEMSEEVMYKHIELYVNKYSIDLGAEGKRAIRMLFDKAMEIGLISQLKEGLYLEQAVL
ncbi:MAG TPA: 1,4-dihydroxy-6-naphthoate synthase [Bacteroidia bacterium]|jgi:1,4-dihydroxy-6-naphthoate synthase|nr:1,4-dihydroxy-6-naphthoate synthase [Bacteroidia bacterium]